MTKTKNQLTINTDPQIWLYDKHILVCQTNIHPPYFHLFQTGLDKHRKQQACRAGNVKRRFLPVVYEGEVVVVAVRLPVPHNPRNDEIRHAQTGQLMRL
jgi:hypothetical protein